MYKSAIGVKGYGDGGIVLGVGNVEPRTEDHAPVSCFSCQRSARILDPGNSQGESPSFFLARPQEMILWSLDLVSKHESSNI